MSVDFVAVRTTRCCYFAHVIDCCAVSQLQQAVRYVCAKQLVRDAAFVPKLLQRRSEYVLGSC